MDDVVTVCISKSARCLGDELEGRAGREGAVARQIIFERDALDELHREKWQGFLVEAEVVDLADALVVQAIEDLGLIFEHLPATFGD